MFNCLTLSFASLSLYPIPVFLTTESLLSPASQLLSFLHLSSSPCYSFPISSLHLWGVTQVFLSHWLTLWREVGFQPYAPHFSQLSPRNSPSLLSSPLFIGSHPYSLFFDFPFSYFTVFSLNSSSLFSASGFLPLGVLTGLSFALIIRVFFVTVPLGGIKHWHLGQRREAETQKET